MSVCKYTALNIANYLVYLMSDSCDDLSNMKINKLLYYAQGHHLKLTGEPLFADKIEAFQHGPIVYEVYQNYKEFADLPVTKVDMQSVKMIEEPDREFLLNIAREYGRYSAGALRYMTHAPNSPWNQVYVDGVPHIEIPVSMIKNFFENHEPNIHSLDVPASEDSYVGERDSNGYLVLPGEWDDEAV